MILDDRARAALAPPPPPRPPFEGEPVAVSFHALGRMVQWNLLRAVGSAYRIRFDSRLLGEYRHAPVTARLWGEDGQLLHQLPARIVGRRDNFFVTVELDAAAAA